MARVFRDREPFYLDKPKMFMPQLEWLIDTNGEIDVDFVGRFEQLQSDFDEICRRIGRSASLPHAKRSNREHYRAYYNDVTTRIAGEYFTADIEQFGYTF